MEGQVHTLFKEGSECPFCRKGKYHRHHKTFIDRVRRVGWIATQFNPMVFICDNCGNMQMFTFRNLGKEIERTVRPSGGS
jgi:hypothetical protein